MTKPLNKISRPRLPLFGKIVGGFIIVIAIMTGYGIFVLSQVDSVSTIERSDYKNLQLTQEMDEILSAQRESALKYSRSSNPNDLGLFNLLNQKFKIASESLKVITSRDDIKSEIDSVMIVHGKYVEFLSAQIARAKQDTSSPAIMEIQNEKNYTDVIKQKLGVIRESVISSVTKSLKALDQRTSTGIEGVSLILGLGFVLSLVLAILIARALTKPIKALKAGTEKVGEAIYETIPITTNDEVADLARAFNLMSDKLKQLDEMRMQLMSEISHEMRTPLQVIKAGCYSIIHTKDGPVLTQKQRDAVGMIHQATNRINQFVNSFLDIAKMEAGLMKFNFENINIVELLTPLVQEAQLIAETRKIHLAFLTEDIGLMRLDKDRMSQVFSNLLSNALKYTPENGRIDVQIVKLTNGGAPQKGRESVRIDVKDSGVGIPKADLEKLFQKFYQAKNTPLVNEKGSGLGLALVKHVAEAHGGSVSVASEVGVGSTFSVILPMS